MSLAIQANVKTITNTLQNCLPTGASGSPNDGIFCKISVQRSEYCLQLSIAGRMFVVRFPEFRFTPQV